MLVRTERWSLSKRAWITAVLIAFASGTFIFRNVSTFLSVTQPEQSEILVVEGWVPATGLRGAVEAFHVGGYHEVLTSGCLTYNEDSGVRTGSTYADWGAQRLKRFGLRTEQVIPVPCYVEHRDRTYSAALAVKNWLETNRPTATSIDVFTMGPHARRSRLLFQKAMGSRFRVGIIAADYPEYDPTHWWRSSEGVREVVGESLAYVYARFFFWPKQHEH